MNIIHHIALKECKESFRNGALKIVGIVLPFFFIFSIVIGAVQYQHTFAEKKEATVKVRAQWLNQGNKNPHGAGHYGMLTFKPVSPLNIFEKGMNSYFGQYIYLETHTRNDAEKKPAKDSTSLLRFGEFTASFLFQFIIPLLVILLCYASLSSEVENNTLRLIRSQRISFLTLISGKCLGGLYKLLLILFPLLIVASCLIIFSGADRYTLQAHIAMSLFYFLYLLSFLFISTGVSALCRSSKQSLMILFIFWIFTCVFIPRFTSSLSENIHPTPSSFDLKTSYEKSQGDKYVYGYKGFNKFNTTYSEIEKRLMKEYRVSTADSLPVNVFGFAIEETEEEAQHLFEKSYGDLNNLFQDQDRLHRFMSFFSPLAAIRFLSMGLSHSDLEEQINFNDHSELYRRSIMKTLNMDIAYNSNKRHANKNADKYERGKDLWQQIPDFKYTALSFGTVMNNHLPDMIILIVWFLASLLFLWFSANKMKVI